MPLIIDPDDLNQGTEVTIDTTGKTITLNEAGNLSADGVTLQCLYSFLKEEWRTDASLIPFDFPMLSITAEQFEFIDEWMLINDATRKLIRTGGWAEITAAGATKREYAGIVSLGTLGVTDQPYFDQNNDATDFAYQGAINEAIQIFGDASNGNFDYRSSLTLYAREQAKTYASADLATIGVPEMTYQVYRFPLANATDLKVTQSDTTVDAYGVIVEYFGAAQTRNIGGGSHDFSIIIDGNNRTAEEIYMAVQSLLRKDSDIDSGSGNVNGLLAADLLEFVGDTLKTRYTSLGGVFIDNFNSNDTNRLVFVDDTNTERTFPFVAAGTISFNQNLIDDTDAIYRMFFTTNPAGDFGTGSAVLVDDNNGTDISGNVSGNASISFDFDYDNNTQGGRTAGQDADVTIVAIGLDNAQYVVANGTITRATGINFSLVSALERNYANA